MAVLPNFEYDIFISYRHNDNRSGWATDFVNALKEELAATIKEPLSIYFDQNPHDGLLETHNVDKSLEGKLKCLIFIPILSQTYCDTKSFAWQHEFVAFNEFLKESAPLSSGEGPGVRLNNGNFASRILPIKIHDLDAEDKSTIEKEIGGALRAIEFIYKEAGVNRPLKPTDSKADNQSKTDYRNQVNKVANAIKEIITALKNPSPTSPATTGNRKPVTGNTSSSKKKSVIISLTALLIAALGYFFYQHRSTSNDEPATEIDKSIAVLPFVDLSKEGDLEYLGDGVAEEIINVLAQTKDLKVIARSSSFQFKGKNEDLRKIGEMLGVSTILEGSIRKFKDEVRVTAQLINVADGSHYWSRNMNSKAENLFEIQDAIAQEVAVALKASLFEGTTSKQSKPWNEESERLYQKGRFFYDRSDAGDMEKALELLQQSVALDSSQAVAIAFLAAASFNVNHDYAQRKYGAMAVKAEPSSPEARNQLGAEYYIGLEFPKSFDEISIALEKGKSSPLVLRTASFFSNLVGNTKQAVTLARLAMQVDPLIGRSHLALLRALRMDKNYPEMLRAVEKSIEVFPQNQRFQEEYITALTLNGRFADALQSVKNVQDKAKVLPFIYFKQNDKPKLDSILNTIDQAKLAFSEDVIISLFEMTKKTFLG